jgi:uncharacterized repeat protein (TIGR03803 family)
MKKSFFAAAQSLFNNICGTGAGITILLMLTASSLNASNYTHVYEFTDFGDHNAMPTGESICGPVLSGQTLYGVLHGWDDTIYKVNVDGSDFTVLHVFNSCDGPNPPVWLALSSNTLYGVWEHGERLESELSRTITTSNTLYGVWEHGVTAAPGFVYKIDTDGTGFTNIYNFSGSDVSSFPNGPLVVSGKTLYGTTASGGTGHAGTVFRVNTDGTGFTNLHNFSACSSGQKFFKNADGVDPVAGLLLSGNTLYGTTESGGQAEHGTIFRVNIDGTGFTNLHNFTGTSDNEGTSEGLVLSGKTLYGTTDSGGAENYGTVFQINTDGTGYTNIYSFGIIEGPPRRQIYHMGLRHTTISSFGQGDGNNPSAGLLLIGKRLYGTTFSGGDYDKGTFFEIGTDGADYKTIYQFNGKDGECPQETLASSGKTLYGITRFEGTNHIGVTIFALTLPSP